MRPNLRSGVLLLNRLQRAKRLAMHACTADRLVHLCNDVSHERRWHVHDTLLGLGRSHKQTAPDVPRRLEATDERRDFLRCRSLAQEKRQLGFVAHRLDAHTTAPISNRRTQRFGLQRALHALIVDLEVDVVDCAFTGSL
jgi:hypothetical protein